jgi:hypothetical protein
MKRLWAGVGLAVVLGLSGGSSLAAQEVPPTGSAEIADVSGPGQPVTQPAAQCPRTVGCRYAEQNLVQAGYRFQSLQVCGANCTTQYWVASISSNGSPLLEIDPVRGGAVLAVARSDGSVDHPSVRVVMPAYASTDAACCPSSFSDTTYRWDAASTSLAAADSTSTPADQFPGWDAVREELNTEGWIVTSV